MSSKTCARGNAELGGVQIEIASDLGWASPAKTS